MAVVFYKEPQGTVLNAYNNSIVEFGTDSGIAARAIIKVGSYTFEVTPNQNKFHFNLKSVITMLINQDVFSDSVEVALPTTYLFPDSTLFLEQEVEFTVIKTNGNAETTTKNYSYLKSVKQIIDANYQENNLVRFLIPATNSTSHVTYFEGYPFDIAIYSNASRTVTLTNKRTGTGLNLSLSKGVNRLFLSNGENDNQGFEGNMPLYLGVNELELTVDASNKITCFVNKVQVGCGVYLKWFNQKGAWSYWKFSKIYSQKLKTKTRSEINNDYENIDSAITRTIVPAITANRTLILATGKVNEHERYMLSQLFTSPKVYLYNQDPLQPFQLLNFKEVTVKDVNLETLNTKNKNTEFVVQIELPEDYTQFYAG